jgi:hypothetical protein
MKPRLFSTANEHLVNLNFINSIYRADTKLCFTILGDSEGQYVVPTEKETLFWDTLYMNSLVLLNHIQI